MIRNRIATLSIIIFSFISSTGYSQNCLTDSGTYYIIQVRTVRDKPGDWPVSVMGITKGIEKLNVSKKNLQQFIHAIFHKCSYCLEYEQLLLTNLKRCDSTLSKAERVTQLVEFENKDKVLWDNNFKLSFRLNNHTQIWVNIEKFRGVGWLFVATQESINQVSESIRLSIKDYPNQYYFVVKKIEQPMQLTEDEKIMFRKIFESI